MGLIKFRVFWNDPTQPFLFLVLCIPYNLACPVVDNQKKYTMMLFPRTFLFLNLLFNSDNK